MRTIGRFFPIAILGVMSMAFSGCTALVIGVAAGAAGSYVWTRGNLELNTQYSVDQLYAGAMRGLEKLDIDVERDRHNQFEATIAARDSLGRKVMVRVNGQTEKSAKIRVRVGVWGNLNASQMIMNEILNSVDKGKGFLGW